MSGATPISAEELLACAHWVRPLARRLVAGDEHAAEDVLQEAWMRALASAPRERAKLRAWLRTTVRNVAHHWRRAERSRAGRERRVARAEATPTGDDVVERVENQQRLVAAVLALAEPYRSTVLLRFYDELAVDEIAARHGVPDGTVRVRLHRAMERLRARLDDEHGGDGIAWMASILPLAGFSLPYARPWTQGSPVGGGPAASIGSAALAGAGSFLVTKKIAGAVLLVIALLAATTLVVTNRPREVKDPAHATAERDRDGARANAPATAVVVAGTPRVATPATSETGVASPRPYARVTGSIRTADTGTPVAGVDIELRLAMGREHERRLVALKTDSAGRFEHENDGLASASTGEFITVERIQVAPGATTIGATREIGVSIALGESRDFTIEVTAGGSVEGLVVDEHDRPIAGAEVLAWCSPLDGVEVFGVDENGVHLSTAEKAPHRRTTSDERGAFRVEALGSEFVLTARAGGHIASRRWNGTIESGATIQGVTLRLAPAAIVRGIVVGEDGSGIEGTAVDLTAFVSDTQQEPSGISGVYLAPPPATRTSTDANGDFELEWALPGTHLLHVHRDGYEEWYGRVDPAAAPLRVVLLRGVALTGRVTDAHGTPIAGARLRLDLGYEYGADTRWTSAGEDGTYVFPDLPQVREGILSIHAPGYAVRVEQPVAVAESEARRDIQLEPAQRIAGVVVDGDDHPVFGAEVSIEGSRVVDHGRGITVPIPTWERTWDLDRARTDREGRFVFSDLYEGEFRVCAQRTDSSESSRAEAVVEAHMGGQDLVLRLENAASRTVTVRGSARDGITGEPVPRFSVTPLAPGRDGTYHGSGRDFENADGRFEIGGLEPGPWAFTIDTIGYSPANEPQRELAAGDHELDVRLFPMRTVHVRALDRDGEPIAGGRLGFFDRDGTPLTVEVGPRMRSSDLRLDERGECAAMGLPATPVVARVSYRYGRLAEQFPIDLTTEPRDVIELRVGVPMTHVLWLVLVSSKSDRAAEFRTLDRSASLGRVAELQRAGEIALLAAGAQASAPDPNGGAAPVILGTLTYDPDAGYSYHSGGVADKSDEPVFPLFLDPTVRVVTLTAPGHASETIELPPWQEVIARELLVVPLVRE